MSGPDADGVLITGVYGSEKSSVAAEITYLLEQRDQQYALLDLDYLGWVGDHAMGHRMMLRNLAAVAPNWFGARCRLSVGGGRVVPNGQFCGWPCSECLCRRGSGRGSGTAAHAIDQGLPRQSVSNAELVQGFGIHRVGE
jgi:hypothetical protein